MVEPLTEYGYDEESVIFSEMVQSQFDPERLQVPVMVPELVKLVPRELHKEAFMVPDILSIPEMQADENDMEKATLLFMLYVTVPEV